CELAAVDEVGLGHRHRLRTAWERLIRVGDLWLSSEPHVQSLVALCVEPVTTTGAPIAAPISSALCYSAHRRCRPRSPRGGRVPRAEGESGGQLRQWRPPTRGGLPWPRPRAAGLPGG